MVIVVVSGQYSGQTIRDDNDESGARCTVFCLPFQSEMFYSKQKATVIRKREKCSLASEMRTPAAQPPCCASEFADHVFHTTALKPTLTTSANTGDLLSDCLIST